MVKIVCRDRDGKRQYGIVDALNKVMSIGPIGHGLRKRLTMTIYNVW